MDYLSYIVKVEIEKKYLLMCNSLESRRKKSQPVGHLYPKQLVMKVFGFLSNQIM